MQTGSDRGAEEGTSAVRINLKGAANELFPSADVVGGGGKRKGGKEDQQLAASTTVYTEIACCRRQSRFGAAGRRGERALFR